MKRSIKVFAGVAALTLAMSGVTYASIPDNDDGEFHVCIQTNRSANSQYTMYVIDPPLQTNFNGGCNTGYTHHVLNQQGPEGPAGPQGEPGEDAETPHVKVVKKFIVSGPSGGQFGDTWSCGTGWVAMGVTWKAIEVGGAAAIVHPTDTRVNFNESSPDQFRFNGNAPNGQASVEVRGTCMSNVVSDGVSTS